MDIQKSQTRHNELTIEKNNEDNRMKKLTIEIKELSRMNHLIMQEIQEAMVEKRKIEQETKKVKKEYNAAD